jgi:hypothetical protein
MPDKPILFSAPMVLAILREIEKPGAGKTQTRRIYKPIPISLPQKYSVADRLWVRENWCLCGQMDSVKISDCSKFEPVGYLADGNIREMACSMISQGRTRPSIHMPRWASRITLGVTDVRYQRLQNISEADAIAEGCKGFVSSDGEDGTSPQEEFQDLWDSLNGTPRKPGGPDISWQANPHVVAVTFTPHLCNIDQMALAA